MEKTIESIIENQKIAAEYIDKEANEIKVCNGEIKRKSNPIMIDLHKAIHNDPENATNELHVLRDVIKRQEIMLQSNNDLIIDLYRELQSKDLTISEIRNELNNQTNQTNLALQYVYLSDSWKITKPFRIISDGIRNLLSKWNISRLLLEKLINVKQSVFDNQIAVDIDSSKRILDETCCLQNNVKSVREFCYQNDMDFSDYTTDIKVLALYLPQFHEIPENNEWWGNGFTEWTNVKKGYKRFRNHYQPRIPDESIGYYDLGNIETLKKQIIMAKKHGIYGFAIYYYWFSGKRLLEKPMDMLLAHPEIEFPYMAIWANENWTRTWDGKEDNILIEQHYTDNDAKRFILDLKKYIDDKRYIRVDGKPVIGIYNPMKIPNLNRVLQTWRETAKKSGIGEILIWICSGDSNAKSMGIEEIVDGEYEFPPRGKGYVKQFDLPEKGKAFDYGELVESVRTFKCTNKKPVFRGSMMIWDNSARKKENYHCWINYSPDIFYLWNRINIKYLRENNDEKNRFLFINAWNEWGEGTYLEPDEKLGFSNINALSKAIFDLPYEKKADKNCIQYVGAGIYDQSRTKIGNEPNDTSLIAIHAHIYYLDLLDEIIQLAANIHFKYDLFITTDSQEKANYIEYIIKHKCSYCTAQYIYIYIYPNKGRDVAPFILGMKHNIRRYRYICHIHTKKSLHMNFGGDSWRGYLYSNLLGSKNVVDEIINMFETNPKLGIVFPQNIDFIRAVVDWGSNKKIAEELCSKMNLNYKLPEGDIIFPAGNMFWARTEAINQLFTIFSSEKDFPEENGQLDGTVMHAIERLWVYVADANGFEYKNTRYLGDNRPLDILKSL